MMTVGELRDFLATLSPHMPVVVSTEDARSAANAVAEITQAECSRGWDAHGGDRVVLTADAVSRCRRQSYDGVRCSEPAGHAWSCFYRG
jgi:hypothetical protein